MLGMAFPGDNSGKEPAHRCRRHNRCGFNPWDWKKIPWRRKWQPSPVFLPGESHGQRSPAGYSSWNHRELDMTELDWHARIHVWFSPLSSASWNSSLLARSPELSFWLCPCKLKNWSCRHRLVTQCRVVRYDGKTAGTLSVGWGAVVILSSWIELTSLFFSSGNGSLHMKSGNETLWGNAQANMPTLKITQPCWTLNYHVQIFVTPWTIQSMEFSRPEYRSERCSFL